MAANAQPIESKSILYSPCVSRYSPCCPYGQNFSRGTKSVYFGASPLTVIFGRKSPSPSAKKAVQRLDPQLPSVTHVANKSFSAISCASVRLSISTTILRFVLSLILPHPRQVL